MFMTYQISRIRLNQTSSHQKSHWVNRSAPNHEDQYWFFQRLTCEKVKWQGNSLLWFWGVCLELGHGTNINASVEKPTRGVQLTSGQKLAHSFHRGVNRSKLSYSYEKWLAHSDPCNVEANPRRFVSFYQIPDTPRTLEFALLLASLK